MYNTLLSSTQNPRIKQTLSLRERSERDASSQFIIEGYRELLRAFENGQKIEELFFCSSLFLGANENALIGRLQQNGARLFECNEKVFHKLSYRDRPDGLLGVAQQRHLYLDDLQINKNPFLIVAEAIEKPGNLGTILRSSDAVGVDGVLVCDRCTDIFNPNVVRASVGTLFTIPVIEAGSQEALLWLKKNKIQILAATPHAKVEYTDVDMSGPLAIAVGTEQLGLSKLWMDEADLQVRLPMLGVADSLNVAMATTILLYEVLRQRNQQKRRLSDG